MKYDNFWAYRRILFSRQFLSSLWRSRKNILADDSDLGLRSGPYLAELDVTYRCVCLRGETSTPAWNSMSGSAR